MNEYSTNQPVTGDQPYRHTQRAPLCLLIYAVGVVFLMMSWGIREVPVIQWVFPLVGLMLLVLAASFHHLTVRDEGDCLSVTFGPIQLFRRVVQYADIMSVETGRTTILDGWGIHMSFKGGWVWNIWGRDCVVLQLRKGLLRIGTDDARQLADFLNVRLASEEHTS
ncbi:MAG: hypothetical protein GY903_33940 [Fuerstiella sp.]|nr:hypothetical protein [Fuerstiella sp.]